MLGAACSSKFDRFVLIVLWGREERSSWHVSESTAHNTGFAGRSCTRALSDAQRLVPSISDNVEYLNYLHCGYPSRKLPGGSQLASTLSCHQRGIIACQLATHPVLAPGERVRADRDRLITHPTFPTPTISCFNFGGSESPKSRRF